MEITKHNSPNFDSRKGDEPEIIVLHTTLGGYEGSVRHLSNPEKQVSTHFILDRVPKIGQLVDLDKRAWHAGVISNPSERAKKVLKQSTPWSYKNPNYYSIGIEFCAGYDIDLDGTLESWEKMYSGQQIKAAAELILYIENELEKIYGHPFHFDNEHIITHKDIASYKPDLDNSRLMLLSALKVQREKQNSNENSETENNNSEEKSKEEIKQEIIKLVKKL